MSFLSHFPTETLTLVKRDGTQNEFVALVDPPKAIHTDDIKLSFEVGDEVERKLPNGMAEWWVIENPDFHKGMHGIPDFYDLKVSRRGTRKPTHVTNVINVGSMNGSQI